MTFTCPRCGTVSHHPMDEYHAYCGKCHDFTGEPLDQKQAAWFELRQATDQMAVARWRETHPDHALEVPDHGDLIFWLLDQLVVQHRLNRVDAAMAIQLGKSIEKNSAAKSQIRRWLDVAYPLSVFPEPDLAKADELLKAGGQTLDAVSASAIRHSLKQVLDLMDEPAQPDSQ